MYAISFRRGIRFVLACIVLAMGTLHADDATSDPATQLTHAEQLFVAGKFADASESYRAVLSAQPNLVSAQAGLVRSLLHQQKVDEAFDLVNRYLIDQPDSAPLLAAKGDVLFRRGEISSAETSYLASISIDPNQLTPKRKKPPIS